MSLHHWCYQNHSDLSAGGDHWTNTTAYLLKTGSYDCMFPPQDEQTTETHPFGHAGINRELDEIVPETRSRSDSIIAQYVFDKNYEVTIPD